MFDAINKKSLSLIWVLIIVVLLGACHHGDHPAPLPDEVDPASEYKGLKTQAVLTGANAENLVIDGFGGESVGGAMMNAAVKGKDGSPSSSKNRLVLEYVQILRQSVRRMEIAKKADLPRVAARKKDYVIEGDSGGAASYNLDINDSTGTFFGVVSYLDFTSRGIVFNGKAKIYGTLGTYQDQIISWTLSFRSLTLKTDDSTLSLTGMLSLGSSLSSYAQVLSMNMVLLENETSKSYWFNNYGIHTAYNGLGIEQTISGRYYDYDHGYVDISTSSPLFVANMNMLPTRGTLSFTGQLKTWAHLNFFEKNLAITADTNGDGDVDWQIEKETHQPSPDNLPPTSDAGADQNVTQGAVVQLSGMASSDPEGDTLSYSWSIVSSPSHEYTALTGNETSTPSFAADLSGTYELSLTVSDGNSFSQSDTVSVFVAPMAALHPDGVEKTWQFGIFGVNIGKAGLFVSDMDGDGVPEIITGSSTGHTSLNDNWYVVKRKADGTYDQVFRSPIYRVPIARINLRDMNNDLRDDVIIALSDGTIRIYDGITLNEIRVLSVGSPLINLAVADLDGDEKLEIIASYGMGVAILDADSGTLKWRTETGGGVSIAIGNVDADPVLEIVTTTFGGSGYVLDGISGGVQWKYINSFGAIVRLVDLDEDGMEEIVGASTWDRITVFDADVKSPVWELHTDESIDMMIIADSNKDGSPEIICGDDQWGKIQSIDTESREILWSVAIPNRDIECIVVSDMDQDNTNELIWGSADFLLIADILQGTIIWGNNVIQGLGALTVDDVDDDNENELVAVSGNSTDGFDDGVLHIFNTQTHALEIQHGLGVMDWIGESRVVRVGDVDGDGRTEIVVSTAFINYGIIQIYDGTTGVLKRQNEFNAQYDYEGFSALAIGDVDNDGKMEIVAGQLRTDEFYLIVFDGATLEAKKEIASQKDAWGEVYDIKLADLDKNGDTEIIVSRIDNHVVVIDGKTFAQKNIIETPARALEVADVDGNGSLEILVGRKDGRIEVYDGVTLTINTVVSTYGIASIHALTVCNLDGKGSPEWIVATADGFLSILKGQGDGPGLLWKSGYLGRNPGYRNHISVKDVDLNGHPDIFIGSYSDIYCFEILGSDD